MPRFLADINFSGPVVKGLRLRCPNIDLVRAQDVGLNGIPDPLVLEWAANDDRIVLTHDKRTVDPLANARVAAGLPMPGVFIATKRLSVAMVIAELEVVESCSTHGEWANLVKYLPI